MNHSVRSILSVPASKMLMLQKALTLEADQLLIDLEDSVTQNSKAVARENIKAWSALLKAGTSKKISIRVNEFGTSMFSQDLELIRSGIAPFVNSLMIPKVHNRHSVEAIDIELAKIEKENGLEVGLIEMEIQIESALGLINVNSIANHPRVSSLSFGALDFMASISMPSRRPGLPMAVVETALHHPLLQIVIAAHAFGKAAYDGPCLSLNGLTEISEQSEIARALGCDGKWVIHPDHISVCNTTFSPTADDIAQARAIITKLTESEKVLSGATNLNGVMIDEASRKIALKVLERAKLYKLDI